MRLFLIRHGETVDNVAGLWAGSRDSALTAHGVLQARRLASHLTPQNIAAVFSSDLQRAAITARHVCEEQERHRSLDANSLPHTKLVEIRERDFGAAEGVCWRDPGMDKNVESVAESESSMTTRADRFLDTYLFPVTDRIGDNQACAVVAHGAFLQVLYKALCSKMSNGGVTFAPKAFADNPSGIPRWKNTAYMQCKLTVSGDGVRHLHVERVNCFDHLNGLKKTPGGIGSSAFDEKQRTVDSFFKSKS